MMPSHGYSFLTIVLRVARQDNVLISSTRGSETTIKYIDFGFAIEIPPGVQIKDGKRIGTPGYIAPEIEARHPYSCNADVWSLGVVYFQARLFLSEDCE